MDEDDSVAIWFLPYTGKWYVGTFDQSSCAGDDFIDAHMWDAKAYDSFEAASQDERLKVTAERLG